MRDLCISVTFVYNFIQKDLPKKDGERTPVSKDDLIGSQEALEEILSIYQPDKIVVWGSRLYNMLPSLNGTGKTLQTADGAKTDIWIYTINGKSIPCMKVNHRSTPSGKSWEHWHKFYTEYLASQAPAFRPRDQQTFCT